MNNERKIFTSIMISIIALIINTANIAVYYKHFNSHTLCKSDQIQGEKHG
jgi:hypothetical protein